MEFWLQNGKTRETYMSCPRNIQKLKYNEGMGGVDLQDSFLSSFKLMRKYVKSYTKIFFYIANIALLNSYILY